MTTTTNPALIDELLEALNDAAAAALGDSNDDEIEALQNVRDLAMSILGIETIEPEDDDEPATYCFADVSAAEPKAPRIDGDHVHYVLEGSNGKPVGPGYVSLTSYHLTRDRLHADVVDFKAEGGTVTRLYADRLTGKPSECECSQTEPSSAFAEGHSVGYYATRPAKFDNPWQQAEYERGVAFGQDRWDRENKPTASGL